MHVAYMRQIYKVIKKDKRCAGKGNELTAPEQARAESALAAWVGGSHNGDLPTFAEFRGSAGGGGAAAAAPTATAAVVHSAAGTADAVVNAPYMNTSVATDAAAYVASNAQSMQAGAGAGANRDEGGAGSGAGSGAGAGAGAGAMLDAALVQQLTTRRPVSSAVAAKALATLQHDIQLQPRTSSVINEVQLPIDFGSA